MSVGPTMPEAMDPSRRMAAKIIHRSSMRAAAVAGALAQGAVFGLDSLFLTPITFQMIAALGNLFGKKVTELRPSPRFAAALAAAVGAGFARDVFGFFPGVGNAANAAITFAVTEAIGWGAYRIFREGGNPLEVDPVLLQAIGAAETALETEVPEPDVTPDKPVIDTVEETGREEEPVGSKKPIRRRTAGGSAAGITKSPRKTRAAARKPDANEAPAGEAPTPPKRSKLRGQTRRRKKPPEDPAPDVES